MDIWRDEGLFSRTTSDANKLTSMFFRRQHRQHQFFCWFTSALRHPRSLSSPCQVFYGNIIDAARGSCFSIIRRRRWSSKDIWQFYFLGIFSNRHRLHFIYKKAYWRALAQAQALSVFDQC